MLRISKLADYATVVMAYIAQHPGQLHSAKDIAEATHLRQPTVTKVLKLLSKYNLLDSKLGANGGYSLATSAQEITLADVINAVEGKMALTECSEQAGLCSIEASCTIQHSLQAINRAIHNSLADISIASIIEQTKPKEVPITLMKNES